MQSTSDQEKSKVVKGEIQQAATQTKHSWSSAESGSAGEALDWIEGIFPLVVSLVILEPL